MSFAAALPVNDRRLPRPRQESWTGVAAPADLLRAAGYPPGAGLFESGGPLGPCARWSILALAPLASFEAWDEGECIRLRLRDRRGRVLREGPGDPLEELEALARAVGACDQTTSGDGPFCSGAVVSLCHELVRQLEPTPFAHQARRSREPSLLLCAQLYGAALAHDRRSGETKIHETLRGAADPLRRLLDSAPPALEWSAPAHLPAPQDPLLELPRGITSSLGRPEYLRAIARIQEHIRRGDAYEVNLTQKLGVPPLVRPGLLHRILRVLSPAPFSAYVDLPPYTLVSSSPERALRLCGNALESRPIKGTRPRCATDDRSRLRELLASAKDRAENIMICDLVRNDLGRVARVASVRVPRLCRPERHPSVYHLVSTVTGECRNGVGPAEVLRATFPPGSMTGAPKLRSCQIIAALEPVERGPYAGVLGYVDSRGDLDLSVVIRTLVCRPQGISLGVGGAITADSDPEEEYAESLAKAKLPLEAYRRAVRNLRRAGKTAGLVSG